MEVLRHGDTYESEQCEECKCVFRYVKNDIKTNTIRHLFYENNTPFVEDIPYEEYVNCPECNHKNILTATISL